MISLRTLHMNAESSTTSTRSFFSGLFVISALPRGCKRGLPFRGCLHEARYSRNQLIFLYRLRQKSRCAFFQCAFAMLGPSARSDDEQGDAARGGKLRQIR